LRAGADETSGTEKILEKLALPQTAPVAEVKPASAPGPKLDEKKLAALAQPEPAAPPKKELEQKPADLSQANEKLSSLLGDKK
jgi:hypothetical protein